ncbi:helix-turn-helix transcriptional regulator [Schaalia sp. 19OD2882]|uniref:PadR family transcriptional regulator n=1 Tax=Schaalia sp. 19OD2882 TaxID=2794089 RepID=UPI001C1EB68C|nr:PadR family transcriptional regulator [Schaalia sp. 19OD2882]QWW20482.1 helix-turn-helix transcriptional regulator [Schaalia sp. 19OD2882]
MGTSLTPNSFWILTVLAKGRRHGYDIIREVAHLSRGSATLKTTSLYAALERLEAEGLVARDGEEIVDGRARRYYRLTDDGGDVLDAETRALESRVAIARARLDALKRLRGALPRRKNALPRSGLAG